MPWKLVYYCGIRIGAEATTGEYSNQVLPELLFLDVIKRFYKE